MGRPSFALAMLVYACGCARDPARAAVGAVGADAAAPPDATVKGELFAFVGSSEGKLVVYAVNPATGAWTFKRETRAGTNPSFAAL